MQPLNAQFPTIGLEWNNTFRMINVGPIDQIRKKGGIKSCILYFQSLMEVNLSSLQALFNLKICISSKNKIKTKNLHTQRFKGLHLYSLVTLFCDNCKVWSPSFPLHGTLRFVKLLHLYTTQFIACGCWNTASNVILERVMIYSYKIFSCYI